MLFSDRNNNSAQYLCIGSMCDLNISQSAFMTTSEVLTGQGNVHGDGTRPGLQSLNPTHSLGGQILTNQVVHHGVLGSRA